MNSKKKKQKQVVNNKIKDSVSGTVQAGSLSTGSHL